MEYYANDGCSATALNVVHGGGRLFQQYVVDACAKMEQQPLKLYAV